MKQFFFALLITTVTLVSFWWVGEKAYNAYIRVPETKENKIKEIARSKAIKDAGIYRDTSTDFRNTMNELYNAGLETYPNRDRKEVCGIIKSGNTTNVITIKDLLITQK